MAARRKKAPTKPKVKSVKNKTARKLHTIDSAHEVWTGGALEAKAKAFEGALVRVRPPAEATDATIYDLERLLRDQLGADAVRVLPREPGGGAVEAPWPEGVPKPQKGATKPAREVILAMARGSASSHDSKALVTFLEDVMAEEGL